MNAAAVAEAMAWTGAAVLAVGCVAILVAWIIVAWSAWKADR